MRKNLIVAMVSIVLTLIGQYELGQFIQQKTKPVLVKDVYRTDLSGLPAGHSAADSISSNQVLVATQFWSCRAEGDYLG